MFFQSGTNRTEISVDFLASTLAQFDRNHWRKSNRNIHVVCITIRASFLPYRANEALIVTHTPSNAAHHSPFFLLTFVVFLCLGIWFFKQDSFRLWQTKRLL